MTTYAYADHQRMQITGETARQYDPNGNQTRDAIGTYTYTPANMLDTASLFAGAVYLYQYDGDTQRALKFQGSTKTTTYLRGLGQVLSEFEEEGQQLRWTLDQVYLGSQLLAATRPPAGTTLLTIGKAGAGTGTVTSTPDGIGCDGTCASAAHGFAAGLRVTLAATADPGWVFVGWSGDLDCADGVVTLTDPKTCVATFALTAPLFAKQAPLNGGTTGTRTVTLQWAAAPNASYMVCWDTTNNGVCDTTWQWNATATSRVVELPTTGTYYWQVKTVAAPPTEADEGAWWSVTVTSPPLFTKIAPATGASGLGPALTLQWTPVPNEGYWVCWDTTNNNACDTMWWPSPIPTQAVSNLSAGTYYWQVKTAGGGIPADNGTWHHFTVAAPALYVKQSPANGATGLGPTVTLQWSAVPDEGYYVCWDTTNNNACDTTWWPTGAGTARVLEGLTTGTYYWQVRTAGGAVLADNGAWHAFTVSTTALFTKQTPGNGATGLGSTVTLSWSSVPDEGYYVCWDTTDNNACDTTWWPTAAGTSRVVEGLATGTYYWQARTAGGAVLADDGTWHHFTVAGAPSAAASVPRGRDGRPIDRDVLMVVVATGCFAFAVLTTGRRRRRRAVAAGVVLFVLGPTAALAQTTTQVVEYYTTDALGSVRAVTKLVGTSWQVTRHDFMPFGEEVAAPIASPDKRLFTGKERDSEMGVDYFGARYYRADVGRFTTVDPELNVKDALVDPQRWNRYAYARNNPLRYVDPDGRADVAALCAGKANCNVDVQQTVRLFNYDEKSKSYVVYSTVSVTTTFSVTAGSGGAAIASATSSVSNVSGHQFSSSELSKMSGVMGQIQGSGVFSGFGGNTTQLLTSFAAKESLMGAAAAAQGAPAFKDPAVNPLQLSGGRANLDLQHNIEGALGVVSWAGRPVGFDPARTYSRFSGQSAETVRLFMLFYSNLAEMVTR